MYQALLVQVGPVPGSAQMLRPLLAAAVVLGCCSALAGAVATAGWSGSSTGSGGSSQPACNTGCCNLGQTVFQGACQSFVSAVLAEIPHLQPSLLSTFLYGLDAFP